MNKRKLALTLGTFITGLLIVVSSCKKINEATELGGDLIPPIDNINTFDTTITVEAYNDMFTLGGTDVLKEDSLVNSYLDEQFLGVINNDPFFGKTDAQMFLELKPELFPHTFKNKPHPDSLFLDSVVLVLDYVETYGDSTISQTVAVSEITSTFRADTNFLVRRNQDIIVGPSLGSTTFLPSTLKDSVKAFQDTTARQLRIRLDNSFGQRLLFYDTSGANNAYSNDSAFRSKFKGFALKSVAGGNAIMGFNLQGKNTKLAIYYRYTHGTSTGDLDTTVQNFLFKPYGTYGSVGSASHNYIGRDYSGTPLMAAQGGSTPDPIIYIQNTPGTFARLKIPFLGSLSNRVVHRAELIVEQLYHISDSMFSPTPYMYVDAYDPSLTNNNLIIPYDLQFDATGSLNLGNFGVAPFNQLDDFGNVVKVWRINLSRYVQHVVNGTEPVYDLRLFSPLVIRDHYRPSAGSSTTLQEINVNPTLAKGRVRLVGNTGPSDTNPHRIRLRIIYSKL